jgi:hypothetical protein
VSAAHLTAVPRSKQSAITVDAPALAAEGEQQREEDGHSPWRSSFGRLLTVERAAGYLGVSAWTVEQYILDGTLPTTILPRPKTASAIRTGKRAPLTNTLRLVRLDRADLDRFVDEHGRKVRR